MLDEEGLLFKEKSDYEIGDVYKGAGTAVALKYLKQSGIFDILDKHLSRSSSTITQELVIQQLIEPKSKLKFYKQRQSSILYVLGGKRTYKEDAVYLAMDELTSKMDLIKFDLAQSLQIENQRLLLYDLSNSYFTGTKAELGGRGESKKKKT